MEAVAEELRLILNHQPGCRVYAFGVKVTTESIVVTGLVKSYYHWQLIQEAALRHLSPKGIKYIGKVTVKAV